MVDVRADEGAGHIVFTVRLNQVSSKKVALSCVASNVTAMAGEDYMGEPGDFNIRAWTDRADNQHLDHR